MPCLAFGRPSFSSYAFFSAPFRSVAYLASLSQTGTDDNYDSFILLLLTIRPIWKKWRKFSNERGVTQRQQGRSDGGYIGIYTLPKSG